MTGGNLVTLVSDIKHRLEAGELVHTRLIDCALLAMASSVVPVDHAALRDWAIRTFSAEPVCVGPCFGSARNPEPPTPACRHIRPAGPCFRPPAGQAARTDFDRSKGDRIEVKSRPQNG